jgi:hypothetical protein
MHKFFNGINNIKNLLKFIILVIAITSTIVTWMIKYEDRIKNLEDNLNYITIDFILFYRNYLLKNKVILEKEIYELQSKKELTEIEKKHLYNLIYQKESIEKEITFITLYFQKHINTNNIKNLPTFDTPNSLISPNS